MNPAYPNNPNEPKPEPPILENLRGTINWDWEKHPPSSMPTMLMWYESAVKHNVPRGATEDFYIGAYWMAGLLANAYENGMPTHKHGILDAHLALMYYRSQDEDPFGFLESFDKKVTTQEEMDRPKTQQEIVSLFNNEDFAKRFKEMIRNEEQRRQREKE
jgi:hypothetical protein